MSLYHLYVAAFGPPEALIFRGTHLLFALVLVFLLYPLRKRRQRRVAAGSTLLLLAGGWGRGAAHLPQLPVLSPTASSTSTT